MQTSSKKRNNKSYKGNLNSKYVYLYGKHAVISAITNPRRQILEIYITEKNYEIFIKELANISCPIVIYKREQLDKIFIDTQTDANHQGIIAKALKLPTYALQELLSDEEDRIVMLDQITDPQNAGAILRSAAAFGFNKIIVLNDNSFEETGTLAKTSSGCLELVKIAKVTNFKQAITTLKKNGYWIAGLAGDGNVSFSNVRSCKKLALIIGNEGKGIRRLSREHCDYIVSIRISDKVESLNAASAASIAFFALQNN